MAQLEMPHPYAVRGFRLNSQGLVCSLLFGLLLFFVAYPVFLIVLNSFQMAQPWESPRYGLQVWARAYSAPGLVLSMFNTARLVLTYQVISVVISVVVAWLIARTDIPLRQHLETAFWISFFLPSLSTTLSWILLLDPEYGLLNRWLAMLPFIDRGPFNIYSFWGIVAAHLLGNSIAIKVMLLTPLFRNLNTSLEEVARVAGGGILSTLMRISIPLMLPGILAVFLLGMIHSLEAFEIELVLGVPIRFYVYSTQIYTMLQWQPPDYGAAAALSTLVLLIIFPLILFQRWYLGERHFATVTGQYKQGMIRLEKWRLAGFVFAASVAILLTIVPLVMLVAGTFMRHFGFLEIADPWTSENWKRVIYDPLFLRSVANTLKISLGSALCACLLVPLIAYVIVRTRFAARGVLDLVSWMPYAIPGILLGLGFVWFFLWTPGLRILYGTVFVLILATTVKAMPLGVQILKSNLLQLGKDLEESSRIAGGSWFSTYRKIVLPLSVHVLIVVGILNFISGARDIGTVVLLVNSQTRPLSVLMLDYIIDGSLEAATVIALIVALLSLGVALMARSLGLQFRS